MVRIQKKKKVWKLGHNFKTLVFRLKSNTDFLNVRQKKASGVKKKKIITGIHFKYPIDFIQ